MMAAVRLVDHDPREHDYDSALAAVRQHGPEKYSRKPERSAWPVTREEMRRTVSMASRTKLSFDAALARVRAGW
jgi:hypothetical protein